jgi:23S rRNA (cytosine1962-C5)-methyltransferase
LPDAPVTVHKGEVGATVSFQEAGLSFFADVLKGQKTGFFLDQRDARLAVQRLAKGKRVLNLFGYTGAFSVHAQRGGASFVSTVDVSHSALELAEKNMILNGFDARDEARFAFLEADVLDLFNGDTLPDGPFDLIICDPPAFAKTERHLPQAMKAYTDLNQACLENLPVGGLLVSSSCSGRVTPEDFRSMLRLAAGRAKRDVRLLDFLTQPADHAERLAFPEGRYLKTAILEVTAAL